MKVGKFLKRNYKKCFEYFCESRWYIVTALVIFSTFFLIGFMFPIFFRSEIIELMKELALSIEGLSPSEIVKFIFFNNMRASFLAILMGVFLGAFPIFMGVFNGYLVGFVSREVANAEGIFILWRLFPHGIFEIPAILFSIGMGIKIGIEVWRKDSAEKLGYNLRESLRFFIFIVFPLLLVAGIIEGILIAFI